MTFSPLFNSILGIAFVVIGTLATLLMYYLWGFPYDKENHKSSAPRWLMNLHRLLGYAFVAIYVILMLQMVPRMWQYQIELPARTVVHLTLGMAVGGILVIKVCIVRFFRHLEGTLIPFLGTMLWLCSLLVVAISVPFALREAWLNRQALPESATRLESLTRVREHLQDIGLADPVLLEEIASTRGLEAGRNELFTSCTGCHDLRTVLARPRTPSNWHSTVRRMADRSDLLTPIGDQQQWLVTAYLIAISPDLQQSAKQLRTEARQAAETREALETAADAAGTVENGTNPSETESPDTEAAGLSINYSEASARYLFEKKCSQCHGLDTVEQYSFRDTADVQGVMARMVDEGFVATESQMALLIRFLELNHLE